MSELSGELDIVVPSSPLLNRIAREVVPDQIPSASIQRVVDFMLALSAGKGHDKSDTRQMVGLAAPQIGASMRIVTIDITADGTNKPQNLEVFVNPVITKRSDATLLGREGCWSCGNVCGAVERAEAVTVDAYDRGGHRFSRELLGFVARIAQHEIDHLDGIRFPDRIPHDQPQRLHWVLPEQFAQYRTDWPKWPTPCPRERWKNIKNGTYHE